MDSRNVSQSRENGSPDQHQFPFETGSLEQTQPQKSGKSGDQTSPEEVSQERKYFLGVWVKEGDDDRDVDEEESHPELNSLCFVEGHGTDQLGFEGNDMDDLGDEKNEEEHFLAYSSTPASSSSPSASESRLSI